MKKSNQHKIDKLESDLKEIAMEIVDGVDITDELDDVYSCFISKELYDEYNKVIGKINKLTVK
jgi:hypothetical protein